MPGERELAQMFDVSRATLRRAIAALVEEGALFQKQGAGTFIRRAARLPFGASLLVVGRVRR